MKSVAKTTKRSSVVKKKTTKKVVRKKAARTKVTKKVVKRTSKKTAKKVIKKVTKKTTKRSTKHERKRAEEKTVRTARMYGHKGTMPTGKNDPGRVLGKVVTLGMLGATRVSTDLDVIAIQLARVAGVGCMLIGAALAWHISGQLVQVPPLINTAQVIAPEITAEPLMQIDVSVEEPLAGDVPVVISTPAEEVSLWYQVGTSTPQVVDWGEQQTERSYRAVLPSTSIAAATVRLWAGITYEGEEFLVPDTRTYTLSVPASSSATSTVTQSLSATTSASTTESDMLVLETPSVLGVVDYENQLIIFGTSTAAAAVELVALGAGIQVPLIVNDAGWWQYATTSQAFLEDSYELYAIAPDNAVSQRYQLATNITTVPALPAAPVENAQYYMLLWYLLSACAVVAVGAILLLIGHHLHHTREEPSQLSVG